MAEINNEELLKQFQESIEQLTDALTASGDAVRTHQQRQAASNKSYEESQKKLSGAINSSVDAALNFTKQISSGQGTAAVNSALLDMAGMLGKTGPLGTAILGLTKLYVFATQEFDKLFGTFKTISESGVVQSVSDVRRNMEKLGVTMELSQQILTKNSEALSKFSGSALLGRQKFENLAEGVKDMREDFLRLGITATDFNEFQIQYMETLQINGQLEKKNSADFRAGLQGYVTELTVLSQLTGKQRKVLADEMKARETDLQFRLMVRGKTPEQQNQLNAMMSLIKAKMGDGMEQAVKAGIIGKMSDPALQSMMIGVPNFLDFTKRIEGGGDDAIAALNELAQRTGQFAQSIDPKTVANLKDGSKLIPVITTGYRHGMNAQIASMEEYRAAVDKSKNGQDDLTKGLANTENKNLAAATQTQLLTTSFKSVVTVMEAFSKAVERATYYLNKWFGGAESPAAPTTGGAGGASGGAAPSATAAAAAPRRRGTMPRPSVPESESPEARSHAQTQDSGTAGPRLTTITTKNGKSAQVAEQYAPAFQRLLDALDQRGYVINSLGGYSDRDVRGQPGTKSIHAYGGAIDINPSTNPMGSNLITDMPSDIGQLAASLGLGWGGNWRNRKDAMHFSAAKSEGGNLLQARNGGIASGPFSGFPAMLHGNEMIQPLDKNSILQKLATTPSTIVESNSQSNARRFTDDVHSMTRKYDEMIKVLSEIRNIQKTIMSRTFA